LQWLLRPRLLLFKQKTGWHTRFSGMRYLLGSCLRLSA
jgi:hypothetical protein